MWKKCDHEGVGYVTLMLYSMVDDSDESTRDIVREPMKTSFTNAANIVKAAAWYFLTY